MDGKISFHAPRTPVPVRSTPASTASDPPAAPDSGDGAKPGLTIAIDVAPARRGSVPTLEHAESTSDLEVCVVREEDDPSAVPVTRLRRARRDSSPMSEVDGFEFPDRKDTITRQTTVLHEAVEEQVSREASDLAGLIPDLEVGGEPVSEAEVSRTWQNLVAAFKAGGQAAARDLFAQLSAAMVSALIKAGCAKLVVPATATAGAPATIGLVAGGVVIATLAHLTFSRHAAGLLEAFAFGSDSAVVRGAITTAMWMSSTGPIIYHWAVGDMPRAVEAATRVLARLFGNLTRDTIAQLQAGFWGTTSLKEADGAAPSVERTWAHDSIRLSLMVAPYMVNGVLSYTLVADSLQEHINDSYYGDGKAPAKLLPHNSFEEHFVGNLGGALVTGELESGAGAGVFFGAFVAASVRGQKLEYVPGDWGAIARNIRDYRATCRRILDNTGMRMGLGAFYFDAAGSALQAGHQGAKEKFLWRIPAGLAELRGYIASRGRALLTAKQLEQLKNEDALQELADTAEAIGKAEEEMGTGQSPVPGDTKRGPGHRHTRSLSQSLRDIASHVQSEREASQARLAQVTTGFQGVTVEGGGVEYPDLEASVLRMEASVRGMSDRKSRASISASGAAATRRDSVTPTPAVEMADRPQDRAFHIDSLLSLGIGEDEFDVTVLSSTPQAVRVKSPEKIPKLQGVDGVADHSIATTTGTTNVYEIPRALFGDDGPIQIRRTEYPVGPFDETIEVF